MWGPFEEIPLESQVRLIELNLLGAINGSHAALPYFFERGGRGVIVNVVSIFGRVPMLCPHRADITLTTPRYWDEKGAPGRASSPAGWGLQTGLHPGDPVRLTINLDVIFRGQNFFMPKA